VWGREGFVVVVHAFIRSMLWGVAVLLASYVVGAWLVMLVR
jgi:hypothetical protein